MWALYMYVWQQISSMDLYICTLGCCIFQCDSLCLKYVMDDSYILDIIHRPSITWLFSYISYVTVTHNNILKRNASFIHVLYILISSLSLISFQYVNTVLAEIRDIHDINAVIGLTNQRPREAVFYHLLAHWEFHIANVCEYSGRIIPHLCFAHAQVEAVFSLCASSVHRQKLNRLVFCIGSILLKYFCISPEVKMLAE